MTTPFLPLYREFPVNQAENLEKQLSLFHQQMSSGINNRTISTFSTQSIPNGEKWFSLESSSGNAAKTRDGFRIVFPISGTVPTFPHGISLINSVTRLYGTFYSEGVWFPLPYVDTANPSNQISIFITPTLCVFKLNKFFVKSLV